MTAHPAALQLRLLQTVVEVAAEKNSTLVLPFPVELLRFLERATPPQASRPANLASSTGLPVPADLHLQNQLDPATPNGIRADR